MTVRRWYPYTFSNLAPAAILLAVLWAILLSPPAAWAQPSPELEVGGGALPGWTDDLDLSGFVAVESRAFLEDRAHIGQSAGDGGSVVVDLELYREWRDGDRILTFQPFARFDSVDSERTHWDVRELSYTRIDGRWELTVGLDRVFWGVTESQHLVDIVNQTDLVESPDGEDKLGQPMVRATAVNGWGIVDLFVLPAFRERSFPGVEGRLRPGLAVDTDRAIYESSSAQWHTDWAVRWSRAVGPFDLGLGYFSGTSRDPLLVPDVAEARADLVPYYPLIDQASVDAQATLGSWLLKVEAIRRSGFSVAAAGRAALEATGLAVPRADYAAATYGFEYTFWSAFGSNIDVGVLGEHLWDERDLTATTPFQNDLFAGTRLALNDTQSTQILVGLIRDVDSGARLWLLEASRRLGASWRFEVEYRGFGGRDSLDPLAALATDDFVQVSLQRHF